MPKSFGKQQARWICALVEKWGLFRSTRIIRAKDVIKGDPEVLSLALRIWYFVMIVSFQ
jgi:hypothetical protein